MAESTHNPNGQPASTDTVYGMPAYADRAAAVNEVHARPHLMIQAPRQMSEPPGQRHRDDRSHQVYKRLNKVVSHQLCPWSYDDFWCTRR
ncbi:hypothetical protein NYA30BAC_01815 [Halomonas sp. NYA30]